MHSQCGSLLRLPPGGPYVQDTVVGILALGGFHTNYIIGRNVENFKMMENDESFGIFQKVNMEIFKIN